MKDKFKRQTVFFLSPLLISGFCLPGRAAGEALIKGQADNTGENFLLESEDGDISISGKITIKEMKYDKKGKTTVTFPGNGQRRLVDKRVQTNLPADIKPGVTYRNVQINFLILSNFVNLGSLLDGNLDLPAGK